MSKNYWRLELGEKERGLKFNMGTLKNIKELTGGDPLAFFNFQGDIDEQLKQVALIVYAAMLSNSKVKNEEPDYTREQVEAWVEDMDYSQVVLLSEKIRDAYSVEPSGEEGADTRA